jgi:SAM-dependent methyltransferase
MKTLDPHFSAGDRLAEFMARIASETYPEPCTDMHSYITKLVLDGLIPQLPPEAHVLDVGCGQGPALRIFRERGINAVGIALNEEDVQACTANGHNVIRMDQNDLDFPDDGFDLVWARHVLEHSIAPFWTLSEFHRVLKPGGILYVEVPAPETACCHETNKNHYSVLGVRAWLCLLQRFFEVEDPKGVKFQTMAGPDEYYSFIARKKS